MKKIEDAKQNAKEFVSSYWSSFNFWSVIVWTVIVMWVSLFIIFTQQKNVEDIRADYIQTYSAHLQWVHKELKYKKEIKEKLNKEIKNLEKAEEKLKKCLQANSMTGAVVDCNLYFNNNKDE